MEFLTDPQVWIALLTLTVLEIVLGIDNIVFISILAAKLPEDQQPRARKVGLGLAMITRIALLFSIAWVIRLTDALFTVLEQDISGRDIILIGGGLFLLTKSTREIHQKLEGEEGHSSGRIHPSFSSVIVQIMLLDVVFSLDSVITAVGMVDEIAIMVAAVIIAIGIMLVFAEPVSRFVEGHPTVKILALSFLILIGVTLIAEGFDQHISKGYIYFAMAFSVGVEMLNLRVRSKTAKPVRLREPYVPEPSPDTSQSS
jgi:predicted tellurium resistance membrane protein TerC